MLVLGGTGWLGRHVATAALADGWSVTCVARGTSGRVPVGARLVPADRDRPAALVGITGRDWDVVIDLAREPGHARAAAEHLAPWAARAVYISSTSTYRDHATAGLDENTPVVDPLGPDRMASMADYGAAKVACEQAWTAALGPDRVAIVRPGLIAGPGDISDRTGYWPARMASDSADPVLVPEGEGQLAAVIDVRDLAAWIVDLARAGICGTFNAVGHPMPLPEHLRLAAQVAGHAGELVAVADAWLLAAGVTPWAGPESLPLWLPDPGYRGFAARSNARAVAHNLRLRPLAATLADTLDWERERTQPPVRAAGLSQARERQLLRERWAERPTGAQA